MIPVNEENTCFGGLIDPFTKKALDRGEKGKRINLDPCALRFCSDCLEKHFRDSWITKKKS